MRTTQIERAARLTALYSTSVQHIGKGWLRYRIEIQLRYRVFDVSNSIEYRKQRILIISTQVASGCGDKN